MDVKDSNSRYVYSNEELWEGIIQGNRILLSKAITLIESQNPAHELQAQELIEKCLPHTGKSIRIGISGSPGVGKSSFIEQLGLLAVESDFRVAVLAIDPSSSISKGSILGDKTRMEKLSVHPKAYIRPSPTALNLGGVARKTRETILLCEAAGFNFIFVETVGVGQSEITVGSMTDLFVLLLLPGGGDELQGIKRGIVEMADLLVITKADGAQKNLALQTEKAYNNAIHLFPRKAHLWPVTATHSSIQEPSSFQEIFQHISDFQQHVSATGFLTENRSQQNIYWLHQSIEEKLKSMFFNHENIRHHWAVWKEKVKTGQISPFSAAKKLLEIYQKP